MFLKFFANLRQAHVPVTPREYLDLMRALQGDLAQMSVEEFYRLARALLIKDERNLDKFDVVFAATLKGVLHAHHGGRGHGLAGGMAAPDGRAVSEP